MCSQEQEFETAQQEDLPPGTKSVDAPPKEVKKKEKMKQDKKVKRPKKIPEQAAQSSQTTSEALQQIKRIHQSQVQTPTTNPIEMAATAKTPSSKADTTPKLSLPSFDEELPEDWQDLATYALVDDGDEEDPKL